MPEVSDPTLISMHESEDRETQFRDIRKKKMSCIVIREGAAEGRTDNWGEVVTR